MHDNSILLFEKYALPGFSQEKRVLEIGPDHLPSTYEKIVGDAASAWDYLDIFDRPGLTHLAKSEYSFPIPDDSWKGRLVMPFLRRLGVPVERAYDTITIGEKNRNIHKDASRSSIVPADEGEGVCQWPT